MQVGDRHVEFDTRRGITVAFLAQAQCLACERALPGWERLVTELRRVDRSVRVVVLDTYPVATFDDIDERLQPETRMTPSAQTALSQHLLAAPTTMLIRDGVYLSVVRGELSAGDVAQLLGKVGGSK